MDVKKKSRSFQCLSQTYRDVAKTVASAYGGSLEFHGPDRKLDYPLIQYRGYEIWDAEDIRVGDAVSVQGKIYKDYLEGDKRWRIGTALLRFKKDAGTGRRKKILKEID